MKKLILLLTGIFILGMISLGWGQTLIYTEDFEDANLNYSTSITEFSDGSGDYFGRTPGNISTRNLDYAGSQLGNAWFAAEDIDGQGASLPVHLSLNAVNVSAYTNLEFRVYLAEDDDGSNQDWDAGDYLHISYSFDGGAQQNLLWVEAKGISTGSNAEPSIDTDFDGLGDGQAVVDSFVQFTAAIAGTGNILALDFEFQLNSGDEDIGIDQIEIYGELRNSNDRSSALTDPGQPAPATFQADQVDTKTNGFAVLEWVVKDSASGDGLPTEVRQVEFGAGAQNTINWEDELRGFRLETGLSTNPVIDTGDFASWSISKDKLRATLAPGTWSIPDGAADTGRVFVWLKDIQGITDGGSIQAEIPVNHNFSADTSGSGFVHPLPKAIQGAIFTVDVEASEMRFSTQVTNTNLGQPMSPSPVLEMVNANGALDSDASPPVSITSSAGNFDGAANTMVAAQNGVATFNKLIFASKGTGLKLTASASGLPDLSSKSFDVVAAVPELLISQYVETSSGTSPKGLEIWNLTGSAIDFSTDNLELNQYTNGDPGPTTVVHLSTGSLAAGEVLVLGTQDLDAYLSSALGSNNYNFRQVSLQFNGNDAIEVKLGGTTTDVIGEIGVDPGSEWAGNGVSTEDQNISLQPKFSKGDANGADSYDPSLRYETVNAMVQDSSDASGLGEAPYSVYKGGSWSNGDFSGGPSSGDFHLVNDTASVSGIDSIQDLSLDTGATVAVGSGHSLSTATITNEGRVFIADNASLVQRGSADNNSGSGEYRVENQVSYANQRAFKYWSSPVSGETMGDVFSNTNNQDWYNWNPGPASNSSNWTSISSNYTMESGRGFITTPEPFSGANPNSITERRTFEGPVHNGPISYSAGNRSAGDFILAGNPYPSAIANAEFVAANPQLKGTLHYWNHNTFGASPVQRDYATWNATGSTIGNGAKSPNDFTAAMQGFFVEVATASNIDVTFANDQRVNGNNSQFFKQNGQDSRQRAWLRAEHDSGASNQILIGLLKPASDGLDRLYDGAKLKGNPNLAFYSVLGNEDLAIQALDQDLKNDKLIPLGLDAGKTGRYTIALDSLNNWPGHSLVLLDSARGMLTNLQQGRYSFAVNQSGPIRGRFYLRISSDPFVGVGLSERYHSGELIYFQRGKGLVVDSRLQNSPLEAVILRSLSGRRLRRENPEAFRYEMPVGDLAPGVYLLETRMERGNSLYHKVYLR